MEISLLGELMVTDDRGVRIDLPGGQRRTRNLISVLAWDDWAMPAGRLKNLLWDPDGRDLTSALTTLVHKVRRLLPAGRLVTEPAALGGKEYRLTRQPADQIDVDRFQTAAARATKERGNGDLEGAATLFEEAIGLWRSAPGEPLLPDLPETTAMKRYRDPLLAERRQVTESLVEVRLQLGEHGLGLAHQIYGYLGHDPANEHLHSLRMLALYRAGRRTDALLAYKEAAGSLVQTLEAPPGKELRRMRDRIAADDDSLRWYPPG